MKSGDDAATVEQLLAQAGIRGLADPDLTFLRESLRRLQQPLPLPAGFKSTTPISIVLPADLAVRTDG